MHDVMNSRALSRARLFLLAILIALTVPVSTYLSAGRTAEPVRFARAAQEAPIFGEIWARTELYFGTSKADGSEVSDTKFRRFLDREITPRFPDGLTQLSGFGQFRNSSGQIIQERSKIIILLYPLSDSGASDRIEAVREAYKREFQQESVLRVDSRAGVSF